MVDCQEPLAAPRSILGQHFFFSCPHELCIEYVTYLLRMSSDDWRCKGLVNYVTRTHARAHTTDSKQILRRKIAEQAKTLLKNEIKKIEERKNKR